MDTLPAGQTSIGLRVNYCCAAFSYVINVTDGGYKTVLLSVLISFAIPEPKPNHVKIYPSRGALRQLFQLLGLGSLSLQPRSPF